MIKLIPCPFCDNNIEVNYQPSRFQTRKSHSAAAGTKTSWTKTKEIYGALSDCPNCKKTKGEIQKALNEGIKKSLTHSELISRLKELNLPTTITENKKKYN